MAGDHAWLTYGLAVPAALVGMVAGVLVSARLAGRPWAAAWCVRMGRPRDVVVPLLTAAGCAAFAIRFGASPVLPAYLFLAMVSMPLAAIDVEEHRLPDALTLPSYPVALVLLGAAALVVPAHRPHLVAALIGMLALVVLYAALFLVNPRGIGLGDVKLAGVLGAYLGWLGTDTWLVGAFLGVFLGGLYALGLLVLRRATAKTAIPFGPFMIAGTWAAVLLSEYQIFL